MSQQIREPRFTRTATWGSNLVVLAGLAAIGWWGHANHWSFPRFSDLFTPANAAGGPAPQDGPASDPAQSRLANSEFPNHLPAIEFSSAAAAHNCGIDTEIVQERPMDEVVVANGVVGYDQTHLAQLGVRVPGVVWRVEKRVGEPVRRGDVLVIIDSAEVGQAKATLLETTVVHHLKTENLERLKEISNAVPEREIREAEAQSEVSRAQRFNAVQKLVNLGLPIRLKEISRLSSDELTERLHLLGLPSFLQVDTDSANLIPLIAPFDGIVTNCEVVRGEIVEPSTAQYVVADISRMWINLDVRQEHASKLRLGTKVVFDSDGGPRPVEGTLTWIGTEIDPKTRTIQARAETDNPFLDESNADHGPRRLLQANAFGTAHVQIGSNPTSVVVRDDALHWQWEIGRELVFVSSEDGQRFEPRIVTKGLVRGEYVQILDGLRAGERVVTAGSRILSSELTERLQAKLGENSEAIRSFDQSRQSSSRAQ